MKVLTAIEALDDIPVSTAASMEVHEEYYRTKGPQL
jgi:hypothetical protein